MEQKQGEALRNYLKGRGLEMNQVADSLAMSRQNMNYHLRKDVIDEDFGKKIELSFGIDLNDVFQRKTNRPTGDDIRYRKAFEGRRQKGVIAVPIGAQAGYSKNYLDPIFINELERIMIPGNPYDGDDYRYFQVDGDSMEYMDPNGRSTGLIDGMWVIAQRIPTDSWVFAEDFFIHIFVTDSRIEIKRLYKKDERRFVKISDNPDYPQKIQEVEELKELWIVKRKLDWDMPAPRPVEINI